MNKENIIADKVKDVIDIIKDMDGYKDYKKQLKRKEQKKKIVLLKIK